MAHQVPNRHVAAGEAARLEAQAVGATQAQLQRVLDGNDAARSRQERHQGVQERRLAGARAARDQHIALGAEHGRRRFDHGRGQRAARGQLLDGERPAPEVADGDGRCRRRRRAAYHHWRAVGQPRVDDRVGRRILAQRAGDLDRGPRHRLGRQRRRLQSRQPAGALDIDRRRPVDHHLRDRLVVDGDRSGFHGARIVRRRGSASACRPRPRPDAGRRRAAVRYPPCRRSVGRATDGARPAPRRHRLLSAHLLRTLPAETDAEVLCLVRDRGSDGESRRRVRRSLARCRLWDRCTGNNGIGRRRDLPRRGRRAAADRSPARMARNPAAAARSRTPATTSGAPTTVMSPDSAGMTRNISSGTGAGARRGWRSGVVLDRARVVHRVRSGDDRVASHPATGSGRLGGVRRLGRSFDAVARRRIRWISHAQRPGTDSGAPFAGPLTAWAGSRRLAQWDSAYHGHMIATGPQRHSRHGQGADPQDSSRRSAAWVSGAVSKRSAKPVSGRYGSRASIVEQRADPVRASCLRRDIDRCWPLTTPASGWPGPMSILGSPNAYRGHLEPAASGSFRTLWGTSWYTCYGHSCKLLVIK